MKGTKPSIYLRCLKCGVEMTCIGIAEIIGDIIEIDYYCENCGVLVRMSIVKSD